MRAKRIELLGSPGVGKSTLMKSLIFHNRRNCNIDGVFIEQNSLILYTRIRYLHWLLSYVLYSKYTFSSLIYKKVAWLNRSFLLRKGTLNGDQLSIEMQQVVSKLLNILSIHASPKRIVDISSLFFEMLSAYEHIKKYNRNEMVFFDEGFAQHIFSLIYSGVPKEALIEYVNTIPPPDFLLVIKASDAIVNKRLEIRDGSESRYMNIQKISNIAVDICVENYKTRGVKIIEINSDSYSGEDLSDISAQIYSKENVDDECS